MVNLLELPSRPARLSSKLRAAIEATVTKGTTIVDACKVAGMSTQGYHKAMKRAAVRDYLETVQRRFVADTQANRALYKARAFEVALDLMLNAKSEAIRARMCEFLAGDAKVSPVSVHIDARQERGGYEFVRPGQQLVDIVSSADDRDR
jgi:NADH:ubiquinone oxidoreductase subunit D